MDRRAITVAVRRKQVEDLLEYEHERELTLLDQINSVVAEDEGPSVDAAAFEQMTAEQVEIVKRELNPASIYEDEPMGEDVDDFFGWDRDDIAEDEDPWVFDEPVDATAEELARLNEELESCRQKQAALQAYLDALPPAPAAEQAPA